MRRSPQDMVDLIDAMRADFELHKDDVASVMTKLIRPDWPQPKQVAACSSTRIGGVSLPPYDSLNLGAHCGDDLILVEENRKRMFAEGGLPSKPVWLEQVHGTEVLKLSGEPYASKRADASYSNTPGCRLCGDDRRLPAGSVL